MLALIRKIFRAAGASAPADSDILVDRRGNVPVYLGGVREAVQRLRPVIVRDQHRQKPHPAEQGPVGTRADQDFAPPPAPSVRPKAGRVLPVVDNGWRPDHAPYTTDAGEIFGVDQKTIDQAAEKALRIGPYGLGRALRD